METAWAEGMLFIVPGVDHQSEAASAARPWPDVVTSDFRVQ
jgi:hypothetical protein